MLQVRRIKPEDISFVLELTSESEIGGDKILSNIESFVICEIDKVKCGCGCLVIRGSEGFLNWIAVNEVNRGKGFGGVITKALLNIADHNGIEEVYAPGICIDFLKKMGFGETSCEAAADRAREVLGSTETNVLYNVSLKNYFKPCSEK
jgi:N-acetylglutamate synthase-like GNAT family acetyltransferase